MGVDIQQYIRGGVYKIYNTLRGRVNTKNKIYTMGVVDKIKIHVRGVGTKYKYMGRVDTQYIN